MKLLSKRSFFSTYNERDQFYKSLIVKNTLQSSYYCLTTERPGTAESYQDIIYKEIPWGSSSRDVINRLGAARYRVEELNDLDNHLILFFKREILNEKAVVQCHFIDNQLYFIHIDFLSSLSIDVAFIHDLIVKKYLLSEAMPGKPVSIKDCFQNRLIINTDVTLGLSYVSGTASVARLFEKQLQKRASRQQERISLSLSEL
jgi:hypothetical protein